MTKLEMIIREALVAEGIANENWRIKWEIVEKGYQFVLVEVNVYEPRKQKPSTIWDVPYDSFRQILHWGDAKLVYNRYF